MIRKIARLFDGTTSIQRKLIRISLSVTAAALILAVAMSVTGEYLDRKQYIIESLRIQAGMVSNNTTAALVFDDNIGAAEVLLAFGESRDIKRALIRNRSGEYFAHYVAPDATDAAKGDVFNTVINEKFADRNGASGLFSDGYDIYLWQDIVFDDVVHEASVTGDNRQATRHGFDYRIA